MRDRALENMKSMFVVDAKAAELGVSFTDEERKNIDTNMDSSWNTSQDFIKQLISYGVTKEGVKQLSFEFNLKYKLCMEKVEKKLFLLKIKKHI